MQITFVRAEKCGACCFTLPNWSHRRVERRAGVTPYNQQLSSSNSVVSFWVWVLSGFGYILQYMYF
eukprot:1810143-Prymnesium_polylepis.1